MALRFDRDDRGTKENLVILRRIPPVLRFAPESLQRYVLHFEASIEDAARAFAKRLAPGARVLDAGAGEAQYAPLFDHLRYTAVDLGVGDEQWEYTRLNAVADLASLPFPDGCFDAAVNIVTLEHVQEPSRVLSEIGRVLRPGGQLLLVTPMEWEEHQVPHDYFRYTSFGLQHLLASNDFAVQQLTPVGGYFRLVARRLLAMPQFFPSPLAVAILAAVAGPALLLPLLDHVDKQRRFTLGHICVARKLAAVLP
ncbi:MAG TPA: class I SAM-dependent methyltransferase [Bryobacteraceae bacterium]|nr:class I SAM-dependent methyltransferase [Bryobacteraceae bacterium]